MDILIAENQKLKKHIRYLNKFQYDAREHLDISSKWKCDECDLVWEDYEEHYKCQLCDGDFCLTHVEYFGKRCSECEDVLCCHKCRKNGKSGDFSKCDCGTCIAFLEDCDEELVNDPLYYRCASCSGVGHPE